ncbi:MAG TPA: protein kinase [Urbifossiella sp.]|nr:protein kinase [Urbifossiella sp.]
MPETTQDFAPERFPTASLGSAGETGSFCPPTLDPAEVRSGFGKVQAGPPGYELECEVGRGGMGIIYRARDTNLNRDVAIKLLHSRYAPTGFAARRFLDEARITGQLQHPGIPPVHQLGTASDGRPFIAMKLIKGETLDELLAAGCLSRGEQIAVFEQVCQAVAYAHSRGVIHRDLKPQNVMVGAFAEVQVMDWGLAKFRAAPGPDAGEPSTASNFHDPREEEDECLRTQAGSFLGTPAYMPPEQAIGAIDQIDERSDVFGLGAVLCALLTGSPPFVAPNSESTRQLAAQGKLDAAFARLDACAAEPELIALCKQCLASDKDARPADAGAVAKAVASFRADAEQRARQAELDRAAAEVKVAEQRRRRKWQLALAASLFVILTGGGAFAWWENDRTARRQRDEQDRRGRNAEALTAMFNGCEDALSNGDTVRAGEALIEIDRRLTEGADDDIRQRAERCRADLALLRELNRIDSWQWAERINEPADDIQVEARLRKILAEYGISPGSAPAPARLAESLVRNRLLTSLDLWLTLNPSSELRELLRRADPDPYRDAMRDAVKSYDADRIIRLADRPEALAQPHYFAAVLGQLPWLSDERRRIVLETALRTRPGDLTLLNVIDSAFQPSPEAPSAEEPRLKWERLRWAQSAVAAHPRNADFRHRLGTVLHLLGDDSKAIAEYREALGLDPKYAEAHASIAEILKENGDLDGAIVSYREAVRLAPAAYAPSAQLASLLGLRGDQAGAIAVIQEAIRTNPNNAAVYNHFGWLLATGSVGVLDGAEAVKLAIRACELSEWKRPDYLDTLAAAYAEVGGFGKAIEYQNKALADPYFEKRDGTAARARLALYKQKKPYRDPALAIRTIAPPPRAVNR